MHPDFALRAALRLPRYGEASAFVQSWPRGSRSPVRAAGFRKASRGACSLRAILEATGDGMWRGRLAGALRVAGLPVTASGVVFAGQVLDQLPSLLESVTNVQSER